MKKTIKTFSAFKIESVNSFDFSTVEYSKFKFGANNIARKFGYILADKFINDSFQENYTGKPIVVLPSAYAFIPTASYHMAMHFADKLNFFLYSNNFSPIEVGKISRNVTYREDYGEMSAEQRFNLIKDDKFHMDFEVLKDKILIFVDDIKITGTHEKIILKMLENYDIQNEYYLLYFAELINHNICPTIENHLNYSFVKSLSELDYIIKNEEFVLNTRVVKYILNSNYNDFNDFMSMQSKRFLIELFYNSIGNEYYQFIEYQQNIKLLENILFKVN